MLLLALLVVGIASVAYDVSFSDVPEDSWFYTDVMTLAESRDRRRRPPGPTAHRSRPAGVR